MKYSIILRENLKKQKGSFIGIFLLMLIISISLGSVMTIWNNSKTYLEQEMDRVNFGDIRYWMMDSSDADLIVDCIDQMSEVEKALKQDMVTVHLRINGSDSSNDVFVFDKDYEHRNYKVFDESGTEYLETVPSLEKGEAYVPISFKSLYEAEIGDTIEVKGEEFLFTIKGFFEDPIAGSTTMGMKNMLVSDGDFKALRDQVYFECEQGSGQSMTNGYIIDVIQKSDSKLTQIELQSRISEVADTKPSSMLVYRKGTVAGFMLVLQNIFLGFLLAFVTVLLVVALIVISHCISSSIEQCYVDLGILKAIGFTKYDLCGIQCMQYFIVIFAGMILGTLASSCLVKMISKIIAPVAGIMVSDRIPLGVVAICYGVILAILIFFILVKISKIGQISPMTAIRGGKEEVFFESRLIVGIRGKGIGFWLAIRQLTSGKKRYVGACMITALLVFFLVFCTRIFGWLGEDGEGLGNTMGMVSVEGHSYDFAIACNDDRIRKEIEKDIKKYSQIKACFQSTIQTAQVAGIDCVVNVISEPQYLNLVEGRNCKYDNEIMVTPSIAKDFGLEIGDTVKVGIEQNEAEYLITGFNQCANDMGANVTLSKDGFEKLVPGFERYYYNYVIEDHEKKDEVLSMLGDNYGGEIGIDENHWSGVDGIVGAAKALRVVIYIICIFFIFVVVLMTGSKILYKEQHDLGVYKSLGFNSESLRISFALRFVVVSAIGSVFGAVMSLVFTDPIAGRMFFLLGVSNFRSPVDVTSMLVAVVIVIVAFFLFAFLVAGKIKKADPGILICE